MRKFLTQISSFVIFLGIICTLVYHAELFHALLPSGRVYETIEDSQQKNDKVKRLIIGDSVGDQLFNVFHQDYGSTYSLASNQAIDIIGQYILLSNFLEANENVEEVYLVYNPFSFKNNLDHEYTYNYFLKPFYRPENQEHFTPTALTRIEQVPYHQLANFPPVAITFWTPEVKTESLSNELFLSDISIEYLQKMKQLTQEHQVAFKIISPPVKESRRREVAQLYEIAQQQLSSNSALSVLFESYFDELHYLDDAQFVDQIHLKDPGRYTAMFLNKMFIGKENFVLVNGEG